jgi:hypothetical protein
MAAFACSHKAVQAQQSHCYIGHNKRDKQSIIHLLIVTKNQMVQTTQMWWLLLWSAGS